MDNKKLEKIGVIKGVETHIPMDFAVGMTAGTVAINVLKTDSKSRAIKVSKPSI